MKKPKRKLVYEGAVFGVEEWKLPGSGTRFSRVVGYDAVAVLPILPNGDILMERQYRHSLDKYLYEIPAGHVDRGERKIDAARRELEEETGYRARKMSRLVGFYEAPGSYTQFLTAYLAEDLVRGRIRRDPDEIITPKEVSVEQAVGMIRTGRIKDAKTICSILYYVGMSRHGGAGRQV